MVDFTQLLGRTAGAAKKPPILPMGDYQGVIKSWRTGETKSEKKTPFISFTLGLLAFPEGLDDSDTSGIDLSKRQLTKDYYITDDAIWRLDEFIRSLGVNLPTAEEIEQGAEGRPYAEVLPETIGLGCLVAVTQYINARTNEPQNQVDKVIGLG